MAHGNVMRRHRLIRRWVAAFGILLTVSLGPRSAAHAANPPPAAAPFTGWAMDAYPGDTVATLKAEMARQIRAGANVVWLGHNNPGEVGAGKGEPALSYAVWAAYRDPRAAKHAEAAAMIQAQVNALTAARQLHVQVVLPVGYQIQMGQVWNTAHPGDLRRDAKGAVYEHGGESAAFQSPQYRRDITAYYRWVDSKIVRPFAGTILMLNLADEPADGDYSIWADRAFRARYGYGLRDAGPDPARLQTVGRFEADYIADYEVWSADQWRAIDPAVKVTMSFCGGYGRYQHEGPDLEAVFSEAPSNFVVTFDAYPRDGLYNTPLREGDLISLFAELRTLGYYAARYNRPLWLWSTGNSWGLNGASSDPGNIADAVANAVYDVQLAMQGGRLDGLAVWNYNIKGQGLFNDTHKLAYDPNRMFTRLSAVFPLLRQLMSAAPGQPDTVVLAPNATALRAAGASLALRADDGYSWTSLGALARDNVAAPVLTHLDGADLPALRTAIVLARSPRELSPTDRTRLAGVLESGGTVVAATSVAQALGGSHSAGRILASSPDRRLTAKRVAAAKGLLVAVSGPVESLFADSAGTWAAPLWTRLLHRSAQPAGYLISVDNVTLLYSATATKGATMTLGPLDHAGSGTLTLFDSHGAAAKSLHVTAAGSLQVALPRRTYALLVG
ncbi:MAG: hypothetical protein ACRDIE_25900 [Chloroflexota bacterium]